MSDPFMVPESLVDLPRFSDAQLAHLHGQCARLCESSAGWAECPRPQDRVTLRGIHESLVELRGRYEDEFGRRLAEQAEQFLAGLEDRE